MKGIRKHGNGWEAYVRVNGVLYTNQFDRDTPFREMREWADTVRRKYNSVRAAKSSFEADVALYLEAVRDTPTYRDRVNEIMAWMPAFTGRRRSSIEPIEIRAQMARWLTPKDRCLDCGGRRATSGY